MSAHKWAKDGYKSAVSRFNQVPDPGDGGTIKSGGNSPFYCELTSSTTETRTLEDPDGPGQFCLLQMKSDGGDITLTTSSAYDQAGSTTVTFNSNYDSIKFYSVEDGSSTYAWRVDAYDGVTGPALELSTLDVDTLTVSGVTTLSGNLVLPSYSTPAETAEHGAGAIGTAAVPATYRRVENGTIITEIKVDLTGLDSSGTENDVIGLSTGGAAYLGRYVVATCGILYRVEMSCIEVPLSGDADVILVGGSAADEAFDDTVANTVAVCDGTGDWGLGETIVNNAPAGLVANYYLYLTQGATDDATYTAGQFIIRLYGHALLT